MRNVVLSVLVLVLYACGIITAQKIDPIELKCLVCEKTIEELQIALEKVDPSIQVDAGGYRLDIDGNLRKKTVSQAQSEMYLSEMLEGVCEKMDDYVRGRWKSSGQLTIFKLIDSNGKMSNDMDKIDIIQDADLNKSLKYYCEMLIEEFEDAIIENLASESKDIDVQVCSLTAKYCDKRLPQDEL